MSLFVILLTGVLLAAGAVAAIAARRPSPPATAPAVSAGRPHLLAAAGVVLPLLVWLLWPGARAATAAWALTGVALWLLAVVVARLVAGRAVDRPAAVRLATAFVLAAATMPALWAVDARARVSALALFAVVWAVAGRRGAAGVAWPLAALAVALAWAAAVAGQPAALLLAAAAVLLGLWPLRGAWPADDDLAALLAGLPVVAGAALLLAALRVGALPPALLAAATGAGLLAVLLGLARLGEPSPAGAARALGPALGGLALLAAAWAGEAAVAPAARLAVFAPAALALLPGTGGGRGPRLAVVGVVFAALAGLPLTAGFAALSRVYAAWWPGGLALLALVVGLLALWLAIVYQGAAWATAGAAPLGGRAVLLGLAPAALAAVGLIQFDRAALALPAGAWLAVAAPALIGAALGRFAPNLWELGRLARESLAVGGPPGRLGTRLGPPARRLGEALAAAVADAANILDGEYGPLWLLALLLLLLWWGR